MHREISYKCLNCDHSFNVDSFRMNASHCPNCKCKVSITKIDRECEHKYQVLDSETTSFYSDAKHYGLDVSATFYCEKCLDIQHREKRIDTGVIEVND